MIPLTVEAKLLAIVFMALMNLLLLKRKRNDNDVVESYMVQGAHSHNVNCSDKKDNSDSFEVKYEYTEKFVDLGEDIEQLFDKKANTQPQLEENLLFVRMDNSRLKTDQNPKQQTTPKQLFSQNSDQNSLLKISQQPASPKQKVENCSNPLNNLPAQEKLKPSHSSPEVIVPPLLIPMEEEPIEQQFHDIAYETKSDRNSLSRSSKKAPHLEPLFIPATQRKFTQRKFPLQPQSQSDSNTRRTEINTRPKEKSACKNHCQCCKHPQAPRQTLKRCLQDLIYSTFEEMIEKDALEENFGHKKKKRSL